MGNKNSIPGKQSTGGPGTSTNWAPGLYLIGTAAAGAAVSGTATVKSPTFNAANLDNIGLQITFTGTPTGTLTVNCSVDNVNYNSLTFNPALTQPAGSAPVYLISLNQLPFPYLNVSYTNSSGSGTLTVCLSGKDLN